MSVDYEKLVKARIRGMTAADLNRFMVTCALVPDLYCPGYSSAETLSKEANLMRTAPRYKVGVANVTATVTAKYSRRRKGYRGKTEMKKKKQGST